MKKLLITLAALSVLTGCVNKAPKPDSPHFAPIRPQALQAPVVVNGSIYSSATNVNIYGDGRAHRVGDIITVVLQESTTSQKSVETAIDKTSSQTLPQPTIFGQDLSIGGNPVSATFGNSVTAFDGESTSDQSNSLTGNITVTIHEVLANGVLVVKGEKWLTLNQGDEYIRLSGMIRPQDISGSNTVNSTQLADARITYSGTGAVHDSNVMGWLSQFFIGQLWPF